MASLISSFLCCWSLESNIKNAATSVTNEVAGNNPNESDSKPLMDQVGEKVSNAWNSLENWRENRDKEYKKQKTDAMRKKVNDKAQSIRDRYNIPAKNKK